MLWHESGLALDISMVYVLLHQTNTFSPKVSVLLKEHLYSEYLPLLTSWQVRVTISCNMETEKSLKMIHETEYAVSWNGKRHSYFGRENHWLYAYAVEWENVVIFCLGG